MGLWEFRTCKLAGSRKAEEDGSREKREGGRVRSKRGSGNGKGECESKRQERKERREGVCKSHRQPTPAQPSSINNSQPEELYRLSPVNAGDMCVSPGSLEDRCPPCAHGQI